MRSVSRCGVKCWGISQSWRVTTLISLWREKEGSQHSWSTYRGGIPLCLGHFPPIGQKREQLNEWTKSQINCKRDYAFYDSEGEWEWTIFWKSNTGDIVFSQAEMLHITSESSQVPDVTLFASQVPSFWQTTEGPFFNLPVLDIRLWFQRSCKSIANDWHLSCHDYINLSLSRGSFKIYGQRKKSFHESKAKKTV